jgi:hypothetical protein
MPYYTSLGQIPPKRHVQFRRPDGALYSEEVFGTEGFAGPEDGLLDEGRVRRNGRHADASPEDLTDAGKR